jgi:hypothetical protein
VKSGASIASPANFASSLPDELATLALSIVVPVQTALLEGQREYAMFMT